MGLSFFGKKEKALMAKDQQNVDIDGSQGRKDNEPAVLIPECIHLGLKSVTKAEAIEMAGELLVAAGYVTTDYIAAMKERETVLSTYIGEGVAIPHGVGTAREQIKHSGICILQFPEGVNFNEQEKAYLVVGIAGKDNQHLKILTALAECIQDGDILQQLFTTRDPEFIYRIFTNRF